MLSNTHNMLSEIKVLGVKAEQAKPQFPHCLGVLSILRPATGLQASVNKDHVFVRQDTTMDTAVVEQKYLLVFLNHGRSKRSSHQLTLLASCFHHRSTTTIRNKHLSINFMNCFHGFDRLQDEVWFAFTTHCKIKHGSFRIVINTIATAIKPVTYTNYILRNKGKLHRPDHLYLLQHRDNRGGSLLEEKQHHKGVSIGGQAATRRIPDVTHL